MASQLQPWSKSLSFALGISFIAAPALWILWKHQLKEQSKPTAVITPAAQSPLHRKRRSNAYRVREIPDYYDKNALKCLLKEVLSLDDNCNGLRIKSLAIDATKPKTQVATIDFESLPNDFGLGGKPASNRPWDFEFVVDDDADSKTSWLLIDAEFLGLTTLFSPPKAEHNIDIIAVSGLGGHAFGSFKQREGDYMWLRDSLPSDLPGARVLVYGYDSHLPDSQSFQDLEALARSLCGSLRTLHNEGQKLIPKLFIGHSLGGLVIKQAMIQMKSWKVHHDILYQTYGMLFFGVPNLGMDIESLIPMVEGQPNEAFLHSLNTESQLLRDQCERFKDAFAFGDSEICCFYETKQSPTAERKPNGAWGMTGPEKILVGSTAARHCRDWESGSNVFAINKNHSDMVKFDRSDENYGRVLSVLKEMFIKSLSIATTRDLPPNGASLLKKVHTWLAAPDPSTNYRRALTTRKPETGRWFIDGANFSTWKSTLSQFLWLHGIPGCGKSVLSSTIIEAAKNHLKWDRQAALAFYYFDFNNKEKQTLENFLRSLLTQFSTQQPEASASLMELYELCTSKNNNPDIIQLEEALNTVICNIDRVYIIVDALDECKEHDIFLRWLKAFMEQQKQHINIIITSRKEERLTPSLTKLTCEIPIQNKEVDNDIQIYINDCLKNNELVELPAAVKHEIAETLATRSNGMFRWAACQIDTLRACDNLGEIKNTLTSLPDTLDETYFRALSNIPEKYKKHTLRIFQWLIYAAVPLRVDELVEVLVTGPQENDSINLNERFLNPEKLIACCGTLVTTENLPQRYLRERRDTSEVQQPKVLRLAHFSVQEYLVAGGMRDSDRFFIDERKAHMSIAGTSINYVLHISRHLRSLASPDDIIEEYPLVPYATQHWPYHAKRAEELSTPLTSLHHSAALEAENALLATKIFSYHSKIGLETNKEIIRFYRDAGTSAALYYSVRLDLSHTVKYFAELGTDVNAQGGLYGNALQAAAVALDEDVVRLLLEHGANVNAQGGQLGSALQAAALSRDEDIVRLLLEHGADANAQGGLYGNALQAAAAATGETEDIIRLLLEHGADVNAQGGQLGSALQAAAVSRDEDVVRLLLEHGADVNVQGGLYGNALQAAAVVLDQDIARLLLEHGANVNAQGGQLGSALQAAAVSRDGDIVRLLLEHGADANAQGGLYGNALQAAAVELDEDIVKLLLEHGANINAQGGQLGSALQAAAVSRGEGIARLLLEHGADANAQGGLYGNALQAAILLNAEGIIKLLLEHGADINAQSRIYGNALWTAAAKGAEDTVRLLLEHGADVNSHGGFFENALQAAHYNGKTGVVEILKKAGALESNDLGRGR